MDRQALHVIQPLMNKQVTKLGLHLAGPSSEAAAGGVEPGHCRGSRPSSETQFKPPGPRLGGSLGVICASQQAVYRFVPGRPEFAQMPTGNESLHEAPSGNAEHCALSATR